MVTKPKTLISGKAVFNLPEIDGRTRAARLSRDIADAIANDLGGPDNLTEVQRQLIRRLAIMCVVARGMEDRLALGEDLNIGEYSTLTNALRRIAADIGLKRIPKDMGNLNDYLQTVAAAGGGAE
ncbi:MAG: hypothetical protein WCO00_08810 [Rhodospirillaceae bacterium]